MSDAAALIIGASFIFGCWNLRGITFLVKLPEKFSVQLPEQFTLNNNHYSVEPPKPSEEK